MKDRDPYALENLRLPDTGVRVPGTVADRLAKEKEARKGKRFVRLPLVWDDHMNMIGDKAQIVARHILRLDFKNHGQPFPLPNGPLLAMGVSRRMKHAALTKLERLGLIEVVRRPKKSPLIRALQTI
jgi:hypothetical protein